MTNLLRSNMTASFPPSPQVWPEEMRMATTAGMVDDVGMCFVYILLARDGSLYTGIAADPARRLAEHNHGRRGAKALRGKRPVRLLRAFACESRPDALRLEAAIKRLRAAEKWSIVAGNESDQL